MPVSTLGLQETPFYQHSGIKMVLPHRYWMDMISTDIRDAQTRNWIAVLPLAAVEQHGAHLPLGTDQYILQGYLDAAINRLPPEMPVTFLPVQSVGVSLEHENFAGTLSLPVEQALASWCALGGNLAQAGVRKLVLANSHGGNAPVMDSVARTLRKAHGMMVVQASFSRLGYPEGLFPADEIRFGIHGGMIETALMLHLHPEKVRMEKAQNYVPRSVVMAERYKQLRATSPVGFGWLSEDLHPEGAMGNALAASAESGRLALEYGAQAFVDLLHDVNAFEWPAAREE